MKTFALSLLCFFLGYWDAFPQGCSDLNIQWKADVGFSCSQEVMTMIHDANGRPYLYVANKEAGLKIYDISGLAAPKLMQTVSASLFEGLDVMKLTQNGDYLYLALGNSFTNPESAGMAIVDVSYPLYPVLKDYYVVSNSGSGAGIVKVEGDYAYLGAMQSGLVILDVSDKSNIQKLSQFIPPINYPPLKSPNPNLYNARGMEVRNGIVYLCYDGGGIRIINCTDKARPKETGRWCNPTMYTPADHPKAYNNCVLDDTLLYVAVDYAGMEVLNVKDTGNIRLTGWWNPYHAPANNWFSSPIHTNELQLEKACHRIFIASGKSDMHVIDVSDPAHPDSCNYYGGTGNGIGTWGIGMWKDEIYLSYVCSIIPFSSSWTGFKILTFKECPAGISNSHTGMSCGIYPNPCHDKTFIELSEDLVQGTIDVYDLSGRRVLTEDGLTGDKIEVDASHWQEGLYFFIIQDKSSRWSGKILVQESLTD